MRTRRVQTAPQYGIMILATSQVRKARGRLANARRRKERGRARGRRRWGGRKSSRSEQEREERGIERWRGKEVDRGARQGLSARGWVREGARGKGQRQRRQTSERRDLRQGESTGAQRRTCKQTEHGEVLRDVQLRSSPKLHVAPTVRNRSRCPTTGNNSAEGPRPASAGARERRARLRTADRSSRETAIRRAARPSSPFSMHYTRPARGCAEAVLCTGAGRERAAAGRPARSRPALGSARPRSLPESYKRREQVLQPLSAT